MDLDHLVKMANQIGTFFESFPDADHASQEIASHLTRYWAPPMRAALREHAARTGTTSGLTPLVQQALTHLPG